MLSTLINLAEPDILGLTLIGEARGEPIEGIVAVASVIRNRVQLNYGGAKSYREVCLAKSQFSCWNDDSPELALLNSIAVKLGSKIYLTDIYLRQCLFIADGIYSWELRDNTRSSTHYLTTRLYHSDACPKWAKAGDSLITIGHQIFMVA